MNLIWQSKKYFSRFYQGNGLDLLGSLDDCSIDTIWTDPPYFLSNNGTTCQNGQRSCVNKGDWDKSSGFVQDHQFNLTWMEECRRALKPGGSLWVCGTLHNVFSLGFALQELQFRIINDIIWEKSAPPPNLGCRCFTHSHEHVLWAVKPSAVGSHTFNYDKMKCENGGTQMQTVWRISAAGASEKQQGKYPAQKPIRLISRCLEATTNPGDLIVDPFAGSSSTGLAAIKLGRRYIGCDRDPLAIEISLKRLLEIDSENC